MDSSEKAAPALRVSTILPEIETLSRSAPQLDLRPGHHALTQTQELRAVEYFGQVEDLRRVAMVLVEREVDRSHESTANPARLQRLIRLLEQLDLAVEKCRQQLAASKASSSSSSSSSSSLSSSSLSSSSSSTSTLSPTPASSSSSSFSSSFSFSSSSAGEDIGLNVIFSLDSSSDEEEDDEDDEAEEFEEKLEQVDDTTRFSCPICEQEHLPRSLTRLHCGHRFCTPCAQAYVQSLIEEGRFTESALRCPDPACAALIEPSELHRIALPATWSLYLQFVSMDGAQVDLTAIGHEQGAASAAVQPAPADEGTPASVPRKSVASFTCWCAGRYCETAVPVSNALLDTSVSNPDGYFMIACPFCGIAFCLNCRGPPHGGTSCTEARSRSISRSADGTEYEQCLPYKVMRRCTKCTSLLQKTTTCNLLRCVFCQGGVCALCERSGSWGTMKTHFECDPPSPDAPCKGKKYTLPDGTIDPSHSGRRDRARGAMRRGAHVEGKGRKVLGYGVLAVGAVALSPILVPVGAVLAYKYRNVRFC